MKARGWVTDVAPLLLYLHTSICVIQKRHKSVTPSETFGAVVMLYIVRGRSWVQFSVTLATIMTEVL
jgi:hypothetical protein